MIWTEDYARAARMFHSADIDELAEALGGEECAAPPARQQGVVRLRPRLRVIDGGAKG
jgi:hypothetical protein